MTNSPLELLGARSWSHAIFTTYSLSLSFFESVVLDALVRGNCRETSILSDVDGVKMALGELGARRVGKDYRVEPVKASRGVFHPKVTTFIADDDIHAQIGSGNLTFGGWGQNLEVLEHLHPSFAAQAFQDLADFYDALAINDGVQHEAADLCADTGDQIRKAVSGLQELGDIRVFHNLENSLYELFANQARELGGATKLTIVSPFSDGGKAIDQLCELLGLDAVHLHAPQKEVNRIKGFGWPSNARKALLPVSVDIVAEDGDRPYHAKMYEIVCEAGRIVISGSPNATHPALSAGRNVELCVLRIQRDSHQTWSLTDAVAPFIKEPDETVDEDMDSSVGVLRAELIADKLNIRVFSPTGLASVSAYLSSSRGPEYLGEYELDDSRGFELVTPDLEMRSWQGERLTLRLEDQDDNISEGFISVSAFQDVKRRAGAAAPSIFAVLSGTEAPEDVAAILVWFQENPDEIDIGNQIGATGGDGSEDIRTESDIRVDHLTHTHARDPRAGRVSSGKVSSLGWQRFLELLYSAMREKRGPMALMPLGDITENTEEAEAEGASDLNDALESQYYRAELAFAEFDRLIDKFTGDHANSRSVATAFYICLYICDRLSPEQERVTSWFGKIIRAMGVVSTSGEWLQDGAAAALVYCATVSHSEPALLARTLLLRMSFNTFDEKPSFDGIKPYVDLMNSMKDHEDLWEEIGSTTTIDEQRKLYLADLECGRDRRDQYSNFLDKSGGLAPRLLEAISNPQEKARIHFVTEVITACPKHHLALPVAQLNKLRTVGVASPAACCNRLIVRRDEGASDD